MAGTDRTDELPGAPRQSHRPSPQFRMHSYFGDTFGEEVAANEIHLRFDDREIALRSTLQQEAAA